MADPTQTSPFAPAPHFPERMTPRWEAKYGQNDVRRGPLRFEEGLGTDSDVPDGFTEGIMQGYRTNPGRPNQNAKVDTKWPHETLAERAHAGSASWVEAPTFLSEFSHGSYGDHGVIEFEQVTRSGGHYLRQNPANINQ
ncbi:MULTISPECIES: hypothetical protein [Streptosporangium]|uniref:Uncharacterized protein n=1 Tax=Streptosporangium brasiliense TaxID=47480 RepID=A0ABT9RPX4_9ACTN|nr:hypothetical protein [Streptosporangium brasiliense]MDP9870335.1 hypothetical protein [Streptosporangium brasiliense]